MIWGGCSPDFRIEKGFKIDLKFHIDFETDFGAFWDALGSILGALWSSSEALGAEMGRQRCSGKGRKWGRGAKVAPGRFWDPILEDSGSSGTPFGTLWEGF